MAYKYTSMRLTDELLKRASDLVGPLRERYVFTKLTRHGVLVLAVDQGLQLLERAVANGTAGGTNAAGKPDADLGG